MRTTGRRLTPAETRRLHHHHRPWTLSLQSTFPLRLRVAQSLTRFFLQKTIYGDIHAPAHTLGAPRQRRRGRQARPARLRRVAIRRARPHLHRLEHARPRAGRDGVDRQPRRRLSRGRGEEDGPAGRVEHVQDRAPPRVPRLDRPPPGYEHGLRRDRQPTRAVDRRHERSPRGATPTGGLGPRRAGGRARRDLSTPSNAAAVSATAAATVVTWLDATPCATTPSSRTHTRQPQAGHAQHSMVRIFRERQCRWQRRWRRWQYRQ